MSNEFPVKFPKKAMESLCQRSRYVQIGVGALGGFITGYVFLKTSKLVALVAGGTILALELAAESGVMSMDVLEVIHVPSSDRAGGQVRVAGQTHHREIEQLTEKARKACAFSRRVCVAFLGGFLVGFGCA